MPKMERPKRSRKGIAKAGKPVELSGAQDLYAFLYKACDIIRGPVSHENFKDYITPLLYFKRISDVWDEERDRALEESGGDEEYALFPEQHRFVIPEGCHWADIRKRTENLGVARSAIEGAKARFRAVMMTAWSFLVGVLPLVFSSGAGCESRQAIGLVTFAGMLVATLVGIAFPPAYFALFSRKSLLVGNGEN